MKMTPTWTAGPGVRRVLVEEVDYESQWVSVLIPTANTRIKIPLGVSRVRSETPKVGETWIIDRSLGAQWTFAALVAPSPAPPVVTGSRAASDPVSLSLLAALVELGLVEDGTSA